MFEKVTYRNHLNEEIALGDNGIYINENDLHDYSWSYSTDNNKISNFKREITKKTLPVVVACADADDGVRAINNLLEVAEKDVLTQKQGKLIIGDYYYNCYIVGSKKKKYSSKRGFIQASLEVVTDSPTWIKETTRNFPIHDNTASGGKNLDYPHDFPYDYSSDTAHMTLINSAFSDTDFVITIYGNVVDPEIYIAGNLYGIIGTIGTGQYLTIDSKRKTVTLYKNDGTTANWFKNRNKSAYIFKKIPAGENTVTWSSRIFGFDITMYEERSEPKWT